MQTVQIDRKAFNRSVAALVVPLAIQNLINVAVQGADVLMLGALSPRAVSAASLAGQVQFVMMLIFFGLASGATVLTAQYWGKGDIKAIEKIMAITMRLSVLVGVLFTAAAFFAPGFLMSIFTSEAAIAAEGIRYLRVVCVSYLFISFTNPYLNLVRSVEQVKISAAIYAISLVVNVALNAIFIFGLLGAPALGIVGAALATTLARALEFVIVLVFSIRNRVVKIRPRYLFSRHRTLFKDFVKYSIPTTINELIWGLAMSTTAVIIGHLPLGTAGVEAAVSANSVASVVRQLAMVVCFALGNTAAIMIGKAIGAGDAPRAEAYGKRFIRITLMMGAVGAGVILIVRPILLHTLDFGAEALSYLSFLLILMCFYVMAQSFTTCMIIGLFRGGGDPKFGLNMDLIVMWLCAIPLGALVGLVLKLPVPFVYLAIMSDEFIKIPICLARYKSKKWLRNVTRDNL